MAYKVSDGEFVRLFEEVGPDKLSKQTGLGLRGVYARRINLQRKLGRTLVAPKASSNGNYFVPSASAMPHGETAGLKIKDGEIIVASDGHYWPGEPSMMHRALVQMCKTVQPEVMIYNGDICDFAAISRWPAVGWEKQPTVQEELEVCSERLHEIALAIGKKTRKIWPFGNHDARWTTFLANKAPEFAKVFGTSLQDHFPDWEPCWLVDINGNTVVKHRFKGGMHAPHNNTINSGRHFITGHLHSQKASPWTDMNGTRWGVDTGCIADPMHRAFAYCEGNPRNWRQGFVLLTFKDWQLMQPELIMPWSDNSIQFRGKIEIIK